MQTISIDLGVGALQTSNKSPFEISIDEWKAIHDYATVVAQTSDQTVELANGLIPGFSDLRDAAIKWNSSTFPNIIQLAEYIHQYGTTTVPPNYTSLKSILDALQTGKPSQQDRATFAGAVAALSAEAQKNVQLSTALTRDVVAFSDAIEAMRDQTMQTRSAPSFAVRSPTAQIGDITQEIAAIAESASQLASLVSRLDTPPLADIERIRGAWSAIGSDINFLQNSINAQLDKEEPFLAELDVDVAISAWNEVATEADNFARNATTLR